MKYRIASDKQPEYVDLDALILLVACTSLVFDSYTEAKVLQRILSAKFWAVDFIIRWLDEDTNTWRDCYEK